MLSNSLKAAFITVIATTSAATQTVAGDLGSALVGGIIGGVIVNEVHKNRRQTVDRQPTVRYGTNSVARQQNRETQTSLNYFGFAAGPSDGVMGRRSRTAISQYQAFLGFPTTGSLTPYGQDLLVTSYRRAQIGGPQVVKAMQKAAGVRGLLLTWRDEAAGMRSASTGYRGLPIEVSEAIDEIAASSDPSADQLLQRSGFLHLADLNGDGKNDYMIDTSVSGSSYWCGVSNCSVMVFASTPQGYQRNDFLARGVTPASFSCHQGVCRLNDSPSLAGTPTPAPQPQQQPQTEMTSVASTNPLEAIQLFDQPAQATSTGSLASYCNKVSLLTSSNGGYVTQAKMQDPELALGEQFCLARTYAMGTGEELASKVQGVSQVQMDTQCDVFGPAVKPFLAKLGNTSSEVVISEVQKFVLQSNISLEQLANTSGICMFSGYRRDDMEVAMGAALVMVSIGQRPYGELIGHHLALGVGANKSIEHAQDWYFLAVAALEAGGEHVFAPGQPERVGLIKAAAAGLGGAAVAIPVTGSADAFPTFSTD